MRKLAVLLLIASLCAFMGFAEDSPAKEGGFGFKAGISLGTDVITSGSGDPESWTKLAFQPDISFGKIGFGIDLSAHFQLYPTPDKAIEFYAGDWVPAEKTFASFVDLYLPKIMYVRYGLKGEDPIFAKAGTIDITLGNGFIMGDYSNATFLPKTRIIGLDVGVDGQAFNFPYVGIELVTGNLARLDVVGARVYGRPLLGTSLPIIKNAQLGLTIVADTNPYLYATGSQTEKTISVTGVDLTVPILTGKTFPLVAFTDLAFEPNKSMGAMIGFGGRLLGFITYGGQLRFLEQGFIPNYFDANYDVYRSMKFDYMATDSDGSFYSGWYSSLGFSIFEGNIVFKASLDGPFKAIDKANTAQTDFPHAKAVFQTAEGFLGGFWLTAGYEKYFIGQQNSFFADLVDATNSVVGMDVNYKTGASVLTLAYKAKYDPTKTDNPLTSVDERWVVSSSVTASMKF